jgi:hypothetical protein
VRGLKPEALYRAKSDWMMADQINAGALATLSDEKKAARQLSSNMY